MTAVLQKNIRWFVIIGIVSYASIFLMLSQTTYLADSEIWSIRYSSHLLDNLFSPISLFYKVVFQLIIKLGYLFSEGNWQVFLASRGTFALIGVLNATLVFYIADKVFRNKTLAAVSVALLVTSSFFLHQGFRVRSDGLATFFYLVSLALIYWGKGKEFRAPRILPLVLSNILMFLSTPKSIYFFLSEVALISLLSKDYRFGLSRRKFLLYLVGPLMSAGVIVLCGILVFQRSYIPALQGAFEYFWKGFFSASNSSRPPYFSRQSFVFVKLFVVQNPFFAALLYFSAMWTVFKSLTGRISFRSCTEVEAFSVATLPLFFALVFHNDRLPFFILSLLAPLCILAVGSILPLIGRARFKQIVVAVLVLLVGKGVFLGHGYWKNGGNQRQKEFVKALEEHIGSTGVGNYYDVIGTLPLVPGPFQFIGPGLEDTAPHIVRRLERNKPDLIFATKKLYYLKPDIDFLLRRAYLGTAGGIFIRAAVFPLGEGGKKKSISTKDISKKLKEVFSEKSIDAKQRLYVYGERESFGLREEIRRPVALRKKNGEPYFVSDLGEMPFFAVPSQFARVAITIFPPVEPPFETPLRSLFGFDWP